MKDREAVTTNGRAVFYASMWPDFRQAALDHGWALGLHGSLANDMDIMAMPWTENPSSVWDMIMSLMECFGKARVIDVAETEMPNHRKVFTLSIWSDFYLDINIIDPKAENLPISDVSEPLKVFKVADVRSLLKSVDKDITFSRMVGIMNEMAYKMYECRLSGRGNVLTDDTPNAR